MHQRHSRLDGEPDPLAHVHQPRRFLRLERQAAASTSA